MKHWTRLAIVLLAVSALAACGEEDEASEVVVEQPAGGMEGMGGMQGMEGMPQMGGMQMGGMQMDGGMMEQMEGHMQAMEGADGERYRAMLPQHRQMVANMVSQYNREMRDMMPMEDDSEWNQTIENLRQDLRQMPEMAPQELESFMPEHRQRLMRLMEMHQEMMQSMQ